MPPVKVAAPPDRPATALLLAGVLAAVAWMIFRIFVGVDFTDEMQYYGEIASLTRAGRLFQSDLFIQQLGYVFLVPFFKLHAALFPELDYLLLLGRGLLFAGYVVTAGLIWRALRGCSLAARLTALGLHFAAIPFQLFAPSYNTMAHLLLSGLAAGWVRRRAAPAPGGVAGLAAGLGALGFVHPPAGVVAAAVFAWLVRRHEGRGAAVRLAGWTLGIFAAVLAGVRLWHGPTLAADLQLAVQFSRAHGMADAILQTAQWPGYAGLLTAGAVFLLAQRARATGRYLLTAGPWFPGVLLAVTAGVAIGRLLLGGRFWPMAQAFQGVWLMLSLLLAAWLGEARQRGHPSGRLIAGLVAAGLAGCGVIWLREVLPWNTGFFAMGALVAVWAALAIAGRPEDDVFELTVLGLASGALFAATSGNGLNNFGVGCAPVLPLLAARLATVLEGARSRRSYALLPLVLLPGLMLVHGMRHPYREHRGVSDFTPITGVPAFRGLRAAPEKARMVTMFRALQGDWPLAGKRVLVIGPQPWIYFVSRGVPATPMVFMHFDGIDAVDQLVAARLFQAGDPDFVVVTSIVPVPIHARLQEWIGRGASLVHLALPPEFKFRYELLTGYALADHLVLLRRVPASP